MGMMGLPSLRSLDGASAARIWLAAEAADMRCGFDRLAERVRAVVGEDPLSGHYFLLPEGEPPALPGSGVSTFA